jgi:hypothetical protein
LVLVVPVLRETAWEIVAAILFFPLLRLLAAAAAVPVLLDWMVVQVVVEVEIRPAVQVVMVRPVKAIMVVQVLVLRQSINVLVVAVVVLMLSVGQHHRLHRVTVAQDQHLQLLVPLWLALVVVAVSLKQEPLVQPVLAVVALEGQTTAQQTLVVAEEAKLQGRQVPEVPVSWLSESLNGIPQSSAVV